eukprot:CAMPEP_0175185354 /NCGR_PEP_ID=MMETSP0093-20121207/1837_1 /TAXON_ID=311494 /ORGANISM="Alexandrium monilatum, Strain CCMP3105" /LENGTH=56 /DNA_ID=CAMNT_0016478051 /DNA_START=122 /DNA_END=289 /DNA_ORIENTATION=-
MRFPSRPPAQTALPSPLRKPVVRSPVPSTGPMTADVKTIAAADHRGRSHGALANSD